MKVEIIENIQTMVETGQLTVAQACAVLREVLAELERGKK